MQSELAALDEQQADLAGLLAGCDASDWLRPSRCVGWSVSDVVLHLAQTNELATASALGRFTEGAVELARGASRAESIDDAAARTVERDRHLSPGEVHRRWAVSVRTLAEALAGCQDGRRLDWVAGELSARTLATTRLAETWIHTGDVADAVADDPEPFVSVPGVRLRLIARLAWRTLPYAFALGGRELSGPVAFELTGPGGEAWAFEPDGAAVTRVSGPAVDLCRVAARRLAPGDTSLVVAGPDGDMVLKLVRTYA